MLLNDNPKVVVKFKLAERLTKADQTFKDNFKLNNEVMGVINDIKPARQRESYKVNQKQAIISDEETLEILRARLIKLMKQFDEKSDDGVTSPEQLNRMHIQITVTKSLLEEKQRQLKKKYILHSDEISKAPRKAILHKDKKAYTDAIYNPEKEEQKVIKFDVNGEEISIVEHYANGDNLGETVHEPIIKMEVDLDFRSQVMRDQHKNWYEMTQALDHSSVEDLISYKMQEDKDNNLLTLDDLRFTQLKFAEELKHLQEQKSSADIFKNVHGTKQEALLYESLIGKSGTKRNLTKNQQKDVNQKLASRASKQKVPQAFRNLLVNSAVNQFNTEIQTQLHSELNETVKLQIETKPIPETVRSNLGKSFKISLLKKQREMKLSPDNLKLRKTNTLENPKLRKTNTFVSPNSPNERKTLESPKTNFQSPIAVLPKPTSRAASPIKANIIVGMFQKALKQKFLNDIEKRFRQNDELDKWSKGYARIVTPNLQMAEVVLNFGLKLYNMQNYEEIISLLGSKIKKEKKKKAKWVQIDDQVRKCLDEIWDQYDTDNSGSLDMDEAKRFLKNTLTEFYDDSDFSDGDFEAAFHEFDADGSGTIEKNEMAIFVKRMKQGQFSDDENSDSQKEEKNQFTKVIPFLVDQKLEHTEFQLLRKMFGDDETYKSFNRLSKNEAWGTVVVSENDRAFQLHDMLVRQQQINIRVQQMQDAQFKYELDYAKSVTPTDQGVNNFQFNSKDFYPNGTYMYISDVNSFKDKLKNNFNLFAKKYEDLKVSVKPSVGQEFKGVLKHIRQFLKNLVFGDYQEGNQEQDEPVVTSLLTAVGFTADSEQKEDYESEVDQEMLRKQKIKDQMNQKQRGLDFIKLNKSVVYSNVNQFKLSRPESSSNSPRDLATSQSRRLQLESDQQKFNTYYEQGFKTKPFLCPGQQDSRMNLMQSLQVLSSARKDYKQFNSVDEQLKLKYAQATDVDFLPQPDPVDEYIREKLHSRRIVNSKKLTEVYVSGKRFTSKEYVASLPYSTNMSIVNPKEIWDGNQNKLIGSILTQAKHKYNTSLNSSMDVKNWSKIKSKNFNSTHQSFQSGRGIKPNCITEEDVPFFAKPEPKNFSSSKTSTSKLVRKHRRSNLNYTSAVLMQSLNPIGDQHLGRLSIIDYAEEENQGKNETPNKADELDIPLNSEFDESEDQDYFLTAFELKRVNQKLRMDLELQVQTFEQYLKVAMLQTEFDNYKRIRQDQIKQKKSQGNEENVQQFIDPQIEFAMAKFTNDEDQKPMQDFSLPQNLLIDAQSTTQSQLNVKTSSIKLSDKSKQSAINFKKTKTLKFSGKKPQKLSKDLWDKITTVEQNLGFETVDLILNSQESSKADQTNNTDFKLVDESSMRPDKGRHNRSVSHLQSPSHGLSQNILEHPNESSSDRSEQPQIAVGELRQSQRDLILTASPTMRNSLHIVSQRNNQSAECNFRKLKAAQTKHLLNFLSQTEDPVLNLSSKDSLASLVPSQPVPFVIPSQSNRRNLNDILKGTNKNFQFYESKLIQELTNLEQPFTRLDAKPQALKDNLRAVLKYPMIKKPKEPSKKLKSLNFKKFVQRTFKEEEKHEVHVMWINKIQKLWKDLDSNYEYQKYLKMFDKQILNKKRLEEITEENRYQSKVLKKKVNKVVTQHKNFNIKLQHVDKQQKRKLKENQAQITNLEDQVREALNTKYDLESYGLRNEVVKLRIEARLVEHIIFQAQKLTLKSDARMGRDLESLKEQGSAVAQDIFEYLQKRDQHKWRGWQESGDPRILEIIRAGMRQNQGGDSGQVTLEKMDQLMLKLINEINLIQDMLDDVERDGNMHHMINKEMKKFVSQVFGHKGWIIHSTSKSNRKAKYKDFQASQLIRVESMKSDLSIKPVNIVIATKQIKDYNFSHDADAENQADVPDKLESPTQTYQLIIVQPPKQEKPSITVESFEQINKHKSPAGPVSGPVKKSITAKHWVIAEPQDQTTEKVQKGIFKAALEEAERNEIKKAEEYKHFSDMSQIVPQKAPTQFQGYQEHPDEDLVPVRRKSKWISKLVEEEKQRNQRSKSFKQRKNSALRQLYDEEDHDTSFEDHEQSNHDENIASMLDQNAAINRIDHHLDHVHQTLKVENKLLSQWDSEDQREQKIVHAQLMQRVEPKRVPKRAFTGKDDFQMFKEAVENSMPVNKRS